VSAEEVNKAVRLFSSSDGFVRMFKEVLLDSGWEKKCDALLKIKFPKKTVLDTENEDTKLLTDARIKLSELEPVVAPYTRYRDTFKLFEMFFNSTKVLISNEKTSAGHYYCLSPNGLNVVNINFSFLKDMEVYALLTPLVPTETTILRTFRADEKEDKVIAVEQYQVVQRKDISVDEVLFHEFGHFLHRLENRSDVKSKDVEISISYKKRLMVLIC